MKQLLLTGLLGLLFFLSCKKSESPETPSPPPPPSTPAVFDSLNGWQKINTNLNKNFSDVAFNTAATGVLATEDGVYKSADSGKTWVKEASIAHRSVTINYFNQQYGYGVGDYNMNLTTNGGSSWRTKNSFASSFGIDVCFVSPAIGYLANQSNGIYKTLDTGGTWQRLTAAPNRGFNLSVFFLNEQQGWYSSGPYLFRTADGGNTWTEQKVSDEVIVTVCFANLNNGWLTADSSVYRTTNGGTSWTKTSLGSAVFDLQFLNTQTGYASTQKGVWKTIDGGATWKQNLYAPLPYFPELIFLDENTGWVTGQNGFIYRWKK